MRIIFEHDHKVEVSIVERVGEDGEEEQIGFLGSAMEAEFHNREHPVSTKPSWALTVKTSK